MSNQVGPSWLGYSEIEHLVIFGDSYSSVGYNSSEPHPTAEDPLGVAFPGSTWTEDDDNPNWVGQLVTEFSAKSGILVYDYAVGGDTISGVGRQIHREFIPHVGKKPEWAPWDDKNTLFVTWVGINDCAFILHEEQIMNALDRLFQFQQDLYEVGARNFLFINVPPINKSPAMLQNLDAGDGTPFTTWNNQLRENIQQFASSHPGVTTLLFSAWSLFTRVLQDPLQYGFNESDPRKAGGGIWMDRLHPTSRMHSIIAHDLANFLSSHPAYNPSHTVE